MAKKNMGWDFDTKTAADGAKSSIEKTTKPKATPKPKPVKKKIGRPVVTEGKKVKVSITEEARKWAKRAAAMNDETMTEYLNNLILADAKKKGIKKA